MPDIQYAVSSYERGRGGLPDLPVVNMFAEQSQAEKNPVLQSRNGLVNRAADMGAGPVRALFKRDGVLGADLFGVSGGNLYRGTTLIGSVAGSGPVSIAGNEIGLFVTAGTVPRYYNGTTLADIAFPDGADVSKVIVGASRLVAVRKDTGKFYWSEPLAGTIDALAFATAESAPDRSMDLLFIDDILLVFGAETVEFWPNTSDADLPFAPLEGRVIEKGIKATGCATAIGSTFAWVTNENTVCIGDENNIVSNAGLQKRIEESSEHRLFTFLIDGTEFLALRLTGETQVYNPRSGLWHEFETFGKTNWLPQCYAAGTFGSFEDGKLIAWQATYDDFGGVHERRWRGGFAIDGGAVRINKVSLRCQVGQTPFLEASTTEEDSLSVNDYAQPLIQMSLSPDAGQTFDDPLITNLGRMGEYGRQVEWRACGLASHPGFFAEWRVTAPIDFRVSGVFVNERNGGR
jgi:hypothetical protein